LLYLNSAFRVFATPVGVWMGNLAAPQARMTLEKMPESSARNLLLAISMQQSGDSDHALRIYLGQPQYAVAWNNLGVIYRERGDETRARSAFEEALQVDPELNEAKLNLGHVTSDPWTKQFKQLRPGAPMMAPARGAEVREAYLGMSEQRLWVVALLGPMVKGLANVPNLFSIFSTLGEDVYLPVPLFAIAPTMLILAILLMFFFPYREVTQAPPRWLYGLELVAPGTARPWGLAGALAIATWGSYLYMAAWIIKIKTPFVLTYLATPNLARAYFLPLEVNSMWQQYEVIHWSALYVLPAALLAINAVVVVRGRRSS
jgi:hypothetical protein